MVDFEIKQATTQEEADGIREIVVEALSNDFPYKPETIHQYRDVIFTQAHFRKNVASDKYVYFIAVADHKVIGFIGFELQFGGCFFFDWFAVTKEFRGQGVGSRLLQEMERWAKEHGYHYCYLYTETQKNIAMYKSKGFELIGTHHNAWFGETEYEMAKHF